MRKLQDIAERKLRRILKSAETNRSLRALVPAANWTARVSLIGPVKMKALNRRYRGKNYATDVLSFEAPAAFRSQGLLGELVICTTLAKRQAREQGHAPETELEVLLVHGVLHLLGFDHEKGRRAALEMERWEQKLLGRRGRALTARALP